MAVRLPVVAVVGRPNVGKSTLFNRIIGRRLSVVEETPGVTRDRVYAEAEWNGKSFMLVDTGGILPQEDMNDTISSKVRKQAEIAIDEADMVIFVVDGKDGLVPLDQEVASILRKSRKPMILIVNKVDDLGEAKQGDRDYLEFYQLGLGEPFPISALHGKGIADVLDKIASAFPTQVAEPDEHVIVRESDEPAAVQRPEDLEEKKEAKKIDAIRIAVVGRPNVGKSSLVNAILGEERTIVSEIPGTTIDAIDTPFEYRGRPFVIIDTAGIRRKARVDTPLERYSVMRATAAVERADVALLVIDATRGPAEQDAKIGGIIHEAGRGCLIVVNKWDLIESHRKQEQAFELSIRREMAFLDYSPIVFVSAVTKQRIGTMLDMAQKIAEGSMKEIPTSELNSVLEEITERVPPPTRKGRRLKIYYATQVGRRPPTFLLFVNDPEIMHFSYERYLEKEFRRAFGFEGVRIFLKSRRRRS